MADASNTLAYLLNWGSQDVDGIDVSDLLQGAPLLAQLYSKASSHDQVHKYMRETVTAGSDFRAVNTGITNAAGQSELVTVTLKFLDAAFDRDIAVIAASGNPERYMTNETAKSLRAAFSNAEKQIINGTGNDAGGFSGLATALASLGDYVIGGGDATADEVTSVYAVRSGDDGVAAVVAGGGEISVSDPYDVRVQPDGADVAYSAKRVDANAWMGLQLGSSFDAARLANIGTGASNTLDDDKLSNLIALAKADMPFTHLVMNRTARKQLQQSRTATNPTGAPAPFPTEAFGVPIVTTDSIVNTEAVVS